MFPRVAVLCSKCFIDRSRGTRAPCAAVGNGQVESGGTFGHGAKQRVASSPVSWSSQLSDVRRRHFALPYCEAKTQEATTLL